MTTDDLMLTRSLSRYQMLLKVLRDGPLRRDMLFEQLGDVYPSGASRRPMVDRDVRHLRGLGIVIEISQTSPRVYTLRGGMPVLSEEELRILALVRDTFGARHPQAIQVHALVQRFTTGLTEAEQTVFDHHQISHVPLDPAIDYTPFAGTIASLEAAINQRHIISFSYLPGSASKPTHHPRAEPHEIEYYDRHFYLVAYTTRSRQVHDFRIDRIQSDLHTVDRLPPNMKHSRRLITFRYRLAAVLARGEISQRFENQRVIKRLPNGDVVIEAEGRNDFFIVRALLRYAGNAELLDPPELRQAMVKELRSLQSCYPELAM